MAAKKYVDLDGLNRFLTDLKGKLAANSSNSFTVNYATYADKAQGDQASISSTYVKRTTTIAGIDLQDNITKAEVLQALGTDGTPSRALEAGAQVNKLEGVQFKGSGESSYSDLTIDGNKKVQIDLSGYALRSEIAAALNFKGSATGAQLADAVTSEDGNKLVVANGDVYTCTSTSGNFHEGYEYAAKVVGTTITWTELGKYLDLSGYVEKTQTVNTKALSGNIVLDGSDIALTGYSTSGVSGDVAATDTINGAVAKVEVKANANASAIQTLNGADTVTGSVAKSIKDAIGALDYGISGASGQQPAGDYVTGVTQTDGVISVSRDSKGSVTSGNTKLVDGGAVYTAVEGAKSASAVTLTGSSATAADPTGEGTFTFKQGSGSVQTIDVKAQINRIETVKVKGIGETTADTMAITSKAVTVDLNNYFGSVSNSEIDNLFGITG